MSFKLRECKKRRKNQIGKLKHCNFIFYATGISLFALCMNVVHHINLKLYFHANMFRLMNRDSKMCKDFLSRIFPNPYFNNIFTKHDKDLSSPFFFPKFSCTFPLWSIVINQWIVIEDPCVHILNDILCLLLFVWYLHEEGSKVFHALLLFLYISFFLFCRKFLLKRFMSPSSISYWFA